MMTHIENSVTRHCVLLGRYHHRIRSIQNDQQAIRDSSVIFVALSDILSQSSVGAFSSRCRLREVIYRLRSMYKAKKDGKIFEFV